MSNIKELIRVEIERLKSKYRHNGLWTSSFQSDLAMAKIESMNELLSFIDTLPDEPVTDCNDLTEAAENSWAVYEYRESPKGLYSTCYVDGFKAGAEWQYQKDRGKFAKIKAKTWCEGFDACKEQMMKGAVEGEVCGRCYGHLNIRFADGVYKYLEPKNISHIPADVLKYNIGDKVKIIIVKEDER